MKKKIILIVIVLFLLTAIFTGTLMSVRPLIEAGSGQLLSALQTRGIKGVRVEGLTLPPPMVDLSDMTITWSPVAASLAMSQGNEWLAGKTLHVTIGEVAVRSVDLLSGKFLITAQAIAAQALGQAAAPGQSSAQAVNSLSRGRLALPVSLGLWPLAGIRPQLEAMARALLPLLETGQSSIPLEFEAISSFPIKGEMVTAEINVQRRGTDSLLTMDKESLKVISLIMEEKLTEPEVELLSTHPIKAPRLLQIRDDAQEEARQAHRQQDVIPEDAYRHVLWSYLLTEAYGQEFAKKVTDAHELGVTDNSAAEQQMDYTNNAVGRRYAASRVKRAEIVATLLNDPEVVFEAKGRFAP